MTSRVATPKQTGGGGFSFEDKVSASFLLKMLAGCLPLGADSGQIESVRFQKRVDGWFFDDIVVNLSGMGGGQHALAISVKSNVQVSREGLPVEVVNAIWQQYLHIETDVFDTDHDYLALVTSPLDQVTHTAWDKLLAKAIVADPAAFPNRLATANYANEVERAIFSSLHCPTSIDPSRSKSDTAKLLKRLRLFQFDFESTPSNDENRLISQCGEVLRDGGLEQAALLWGELLQVARRFAATGGDLTRSQLADQVRIKFSLKEFPNYVFDWEKIADDFTIRTSRVRDTLGGKLQIPRTETKRCRAKGRVSVLVGTSGSGKTVLAKQIATEAAATGHALWLTPTDLNSGTHSSQLAELMLTHTLPELLAESTIQDGVVVVDGVERLNQSGLEILATLMDCGRAGSNKSPWMFIFTCLVESWEETLRALTRVINSEEIGFDLEAINFQPADHRAEIANAFPKLTKLLFQLHLEAVFKNLKILDVVLSNLKLEEDTQKWVGETDILDWYWQQVIGRGADGTARSRFLQKLGCIEADRFQSAIPVTEFDSTECQLSSQLRLDRAIWNRDERLGFEHDLFGNWSRTRFLISQQDDICTIVRQKALNPRWHSAIRLYGLRLLENQSLGVDRWLDLISELALDGNYSVESDLILESVVFAANVDEQLDAVWMSLCEPEGQLLNRLLTRFLHVAMIQSISSDSPGSDAISSHNRYPFSPMWLPVLRVLYRHRAAACRLSTDKVTEIAELWLKTVRDTYPFRDEAAQILIDATHHVVDEIRGDNWKFDRELSERVFSRLLSASLVRPDEVAELAIKLAERRDDSFFASDDSEDEVDDEKDGQGEVRSSLHPIRGPLSDPWPDGPLRRVRRDVHKGFLSSSDPLQYLFSVRPDAANEVLLSLLIREPMPRGHLRRSSSMGIDEFLHVAAVRNWSPSIFFHGPFLSLLRIDSEKAIELVVAITNFVTDRWIANRDEPPPPVALTVDGEETQFFGSSDAYHWYRDSPFSPSVVVSPLMALEKWLYLCIESDVPVKMAIQQLLRSSQSTAIIGVLAAVGRRYPSLFNDELAALVPCWHLQVWEEHYRIQCTEMLLNMTMMQWVRWGERIFDIVKEWHTLTHRKITLGETLFRLCVTDEDFRKRMNSIQSGWVEALSRLDDSDEDFDWLESISIRFDDRNWTIRENNEGILLEVVEPEQRTKRLAAAREENELTRDILALPRYCRHLIDERQQLQSDELESLWQRIHRVASNADLIRSRGETPEHAILGGIAAISLLHVDWLDSAPERQKWCREQFHNVMNSPSPHPEFHFADSITNYYWDNFVAMLLLECLAADPADEETRWLCAKFALAANYSVIQDLMSFAFEHRNRLGEDFFRLQHVIIVSSGLRNVKIVAHGGNSFWDCPDIEFDVKPYYAQLVRDFVTSALSPDPPTLVEVAEQTTDKIFEMVRMQHDARHSKPWSDETEESIMNRIKRGRGFEPLHIHAGFQWLESLDLESDPQRRTKWIATVQSILLGILRPLGGIEEALSDDRDDEKFFSSPGEWDTWVFDMIAVIIPKLNERESARPLWEPILSLGLDRMHWVDSFLSAWIINGLKVEGREEQFFREWKNMIDYAWSRENWRETEVRSHRSNDALFHDLMGFSSFGHGSLRDEKYRPYVAAMKPQFDKWTDTFFPHPEAISYFARFLVAPSAIDFLRDGIHRIAQATTEFEDWHWRDFYHLERSLLNLLQHDWDANSKLIKSDNAIRKDFTIILKSMTDRQSKRAMELQDRIFRAV